MPIYEYRHDEVEADPPCPLGERFEVEQPFADAALKTCPECGRDVRRLISRTFINSPTSDSELKSMGFTKLVKRDDGVYENVTRSDKESRYMERDKPETMPDLKGKISD